MLHSRQTWPIAAALLQFAHPEVQQADPEAWHRDLSEVRRLGFTSVDLTDSWVQIADLAGQRLRDLQLVLDSLGLDVPALSVTRRSVIDPVTGNENLAYAHRTIEAAAALGVGVLSLGLHRPLTPEQSRQLWFWTAPGNSDPIGDREVWDLAVARFREIGRHAAENNMLVSLEMYEDTFLGTADSAVRLVSDIDLPNVGLNPDIGNLVRLHKPVEDWREILAKTLPYTNYWQVKNYFRAEDPDSGVIVSLPAPLELGFINYRDAIRDALAVGFQGVFCCEHYGGDGLGVSAMNMRYLRSLLPDAGDDGDATAGAEISAASVS